MLHFRSPENGSSPRSVHVQRVSRGIPRLHQQCLSCGSLPSTCGQSWTGTGSTFFISLHHHESEAMQGQLANLLVEGSDFNISTLSVCFPQMAILSTNSRFLHDNLVLYAERIATKFPPGRVTSSCF